MEASHGDEDSSFPERSCDVESAGILVRLNADERDNPDIAATPKAGEESGHVDARIRLVDRLDVDGNVRPKNPPLGAIGRNSVKGGERIRGNHRAPPADHVSIIVVVRRPN
jgi:hypothetical protein